MKKTRKRRFTDKKDNDIVRMFKEYLKAEIKKDLHRIYDEEPKLVNSSDPLIFQLDIDK